MTRKALELLSENEIKQVPRFIPKPTMGRVVSVYDGDTITIVSYLGAELYKFSVRVLGVDTPEMRGSSEYEKKLAVKAKNFVKLMCLDKVVELKNHGKEKYGRVLADVFVDGVSIGRKLIEADLAYEYSGGAKREWVCAD